MANHKLSPGGTAMGFMFGRKSGLELMQNCDLPPPLKVFSPPVEKSGSITAAVQDNEGSENEKLELLKALRLSQTRAREAERRYQALCEERDSLSNLLLKESLRSLACRNSVRLLELQVSHLQKMQKQINTREESSNGSDSTWLVALAFCVGIAGFGYGYFFCFDL